MLSDVKKNTGYQDQQFSFIVQFLLEIQYHHQISIQSIFSFVHLVSSNFMILIFDQLFFYFALGQLTVVS